MLRTVFMGTPEFAATVLNKLVDAGMPPLAVVCQPARASGRGLKLEPSEVEVLARKLSLPVFAAESANTPEVIAALRALQPDLILVAAFGQLLKKELLELPKLFCLNVHGSLLPKYRGAAPIQRAIWNGDIETGVTIQKMVRQLDAGDILLKKTTPIGPEETSGELFTRLAELGGNALVEAVQLVESGNYILTPQVASEATHAAKIQKEDSKLDWNETAETLLRKIRALQPWPVAETRLDGVRLKIFGAQAVKVSQHKPPGSLTTDHKTSLIVHCGGDTALALTRIQLENRKKMETRDFLMAYRGNFPFSAFSH